MAWNDSAETVVAGTGEAYVAAVGTTAPANEGTALAPATWTGLGYHTEDGVSINKSLELVEFRAWQSKYVIRRERGEEEFRITFSLLQWTSTSVPLAFGGGSIVDLGSSHYKYVPPDDADGLVEKMLVLDVIDGTEKLRFVVPRGTVTEGVESQFARNQMSPLPITFKALEPETGGDAWYFLTNVDGFAAGS